MAPADPGALDPERLLLGARRHLDVPRARDTLQLPADVHGVADVLERVRADGEGELPVGERPRLLVADVALHPGLGGEALRGRVGRAVEAAGRVRHEVD